MKISFLSCPAGLYWNEQYCDWPQMVKCQSKKPQSDTEVEPEETEEETDEEVYEAESKPTKKPTK